MLLTVPQKYLKGLLKDFGALKINQIEQLLKMKDKHYTYKQMALPMIHNGELREIGNFLCYPGREIISENIIAVDIMLKIENEKIDVIQKGAEPFNITFFKHKQDKLWRFDICVVKPGYEILVTAALEGINAKYRTVIFVLENPDQHKLLIAPCDYCFVWQEKGEYHFYKETR